MRHIIIGLIAFVSFLSCTERSKVSERSSNRIVVDALGREVSIPDSISKIVCIRPSAIRLVIYAGGLPYICGVEESELKNRDYTHLYAYPQLNQLPSIGPSMGGDPELILASCPDVIFMASTTKADADELQNKLHIPVITLEYGDIGKNRKVFFNSLKLIGEVLDTQSQTDSLTGYIEKQINELSQRAAESAKNVNAYIGGISYKGTKDIISTDPYYAGLQMVLANNVAKSIDPRYISPITGTYIDIEALIEWNPEVIFIDQHGVGLVKENFKTQPKLFALLTAVKDKAIYKVWPYNNYHSNFEVMLMNAWYMGKILYPDQFQDIKIVEKVDEISEHFLGVPVGERLSQEWGNYSENSIL